MKPLFCSDFFFFRLWRLIYILQFLVIFTRNQIVDNYNLIDIHMCISVCFYLCMSVFFGVCICSCLFVCVCVCFSLTQCLTLSVRLWICWLDFLYKGKTTPTPIKWGMTPNCIRWWASSSETRWSVKDPLIPLSPGLLWPGVVVPVMIPSMG